MLALKKNKGHYMVKCEHEKKRKKQFFHLVIDYLDWPYKSDNFFQVNCRLGSFQIQARPELPTRAPVPESTCWAEPGVAVGLEISRRVQVSKKLPEKIRERHKDSKQKQKEKESYWILTLTDLKGTPAWRIVLFCPPPQANTYRPLNTWSKED